MHMGLFGPKYRKPTTAEKNEINAILSRTMTTCKHLIGIFIVALIGLIYAIVKGKEK